MHWLKITLTLSVEEETKVHYSEHVKEEATATDCNQTYWRTIDNYRTMLCHILIKKYHTWWPLQQEKGTLGVCKWTNIIKLETSTQFKHLYVSHSSIYYYGCMQIFVFILCFSTFFLDIFPSKLNFSYWIN